MSNKTTVCVDGVSIELSNDPDFEIIVEWRFFDGRKIRDIRRRFDIKEDEYAAIFEMIYDDEDRTDLERIARYMQERGHDLLSQCTLCNGLIEKAWGASDPWEWEQLRCYPIDCGVRGVSCSVNQAFLPN